MLLLQHQLCKLNYQYKGSAFNLLCVEMYGNKMILKSIKFTCAQLNVLEELSPLEMWIKMDVESLYNSVVKEQKTPPNLMSCVTQITLLQSNEGA